MKSSKIVRKTILEVVDNQLRDLNPPETKETFDRLIKEGYSKEEARRLIGSAVASEIFEVLKQQKPYDHQRFVEALGRLPESAYE